MSNGTTIHVKEEEPKSDRSSLTVETGNDIKTEVMDDVELQKEMDLMDKAGKMADETVEEAKQKVSEMGKEKASEVVQEVKESASEVVVSVTDGASDLISTATGTAADAASTVKDNYNAEIGEFK